MEAGLKWPGPEEEKMWGKECKHKLIWMFEHTSRRVLSFSSSVSVVKNLPAMQQMWVRSLGWEDSPGGWNGNPLQYSCLGNPRDRGVWQATVYGILKESDTTEQLGNKTTKEGTADMWSLYGHFYGGFEIWKPLSRVLKWHWSDVTLCYCRNTAEAEQAILRGKLPQISPHLAID